ncbi:uncharacterized protein BDZ99DRAFT_493930 [Mytilinidion resinicola]|uniref:Zn(2)-C6 fungal-type domain-containing protein n=1 Tax=Mytilinidion resinicola TaxID=574789 RepID=A0A6A6Z5L3_9PEZI|nr:uncharacterized protein BDZ99DRAFT_493930 [Mytilinidion resinicola]KAF2816019.1 hypothetical protein BDZ99DRAFT_493930 [Mytilinidion resinicola]
MHSKLALIAQCDERRPSCGQCAKKSRPCSYEYGKVAFFVDESEQQGGLCPKRPAGNFETPPQALADTAWGTNGAITKYTTPEATIILSVRSSRGSKSGNGVFQTLTPICVSKNVKSSTPFNGVPRIPRSPICSETKLCDQFLAVIGTDPPNQNPSEIWGSWIRLIPSRIGQHPALDYAAAAYAEGSVAYVSKDPAQAAAARTSYSRALKCLQSAVLDRSSEFLTETLSAIKLLSTFELLMGMASFAWVSHTQGLAKLLVARGPRLADDEIERSIFYSSYPLEIAEAILSDSVSDFDNEDWLFFPPPETISEYPAFDTACQAVMQQYVRVPRLMKLVRTYLQDPNNLILRNEAVDLARKLYLSNLDSLVSTALVDTADLVPTNSPDLREYYPDSFKYHSIKILDLLVHYWTCRVFLLGLIQTLCSTQYFSSSFPLEEIIEEDERAAGYILMSSEFAASVKPMPTGAVLMIMPLQIAFGTWHRSERRQGFYGERWNRAVCLKKWSLDSSNEYLSIWGGREQSTDELEAKTRAFEGAPLEPWMRRRKWSVEETRHKSQRLRNGIVEPEQ